MKLSGPLALVVALLLVAGSAAAPVQQPEFPVLITDTLMPGNTRRSDYEILEAALGAMAKERKWPIRMRVERAMADEPVYPTSLKILTRQVSRNTTIDVTFRAWVILIVDGKKYDFGMVTERYYPRASQSGYDATEELFHNAVRKIADKIEPLLFVRNKSGALIAQYAADPARNP